MERFPDLIAVSLMTGICKHSALCGPATTTVRSYLGTVWSWSLGTVFQPTRSKGHSASAYRTALANWSAALTRGHARFTDLGCISHAASATRSHRRYASSEESHASECGNGFADA